MSKKGLPIHILDELIKINTEQDLRIRQIHVYIEGQDPIYHEFMRAHRENLFSATKVYTSITIGMAIDDGMIGIDDYSATVPGTLVYYWSSR